MSWRPAADNLSFSMIFGHGSAFAGVDQRQKQGSRAGPPVRPPVALRLFWPLLPAGALRADWPGTRAAEQCRDIYAHVFTPSEAHLSSVAAQLDGPLPPPDSSVMQRFGGIAFDGINQRANARDR